MASTTSILINVGAKVQPAITELKKIDKALGDQKTSTERWAGGFSKAAVVATAALTGIVALGAVWTKQAMEDQAGQAKLATSLRNTAGATKAQIAAAESWITAQGKALGVTDDQLRPALQTLAVATGDVGKAQKLAALAMDISAARGIPVETAANAIAKAYVGQTTSLNKLVPGMDQAIVKSGDFTKVQAELARVTGGQAATAANTAAGQVARLKVAFSETTEGIGAALLPVLNTLLPIVQTVATAFQDHANILGPLVVMVAGFAAAIVAVSYAMKAYAVIQKVITGLSKAWAAITRAVAIAQWLMNVAMSANPIGLIVIAVIAVIAVFILMWKKFAWFRDGIKGVLSAILKPFQMYFGLIKKSIQIVIDAVKWVWDKLKGLGGFIAKLFGGGSKTLDVKVASKSFAAVPETSMMSRAAAAPSLESIGASTATYISDERLARAVAALLLRSDARNGRAVFAN